MIISPSIRRQRGGLMILVMVVGLGIGLGLAALATFSTGQGEEAKRRITELKQTAAIQYATDFQLSDLASLYEEQTDETSNPAQVLENSKHLHSVDSSLLTTCLADMPWGTPPHNASGAVASLWNANDPVDPEDDDYAKNSAQLIAAGTKEIPGVDREIKYAFEHYGRQLTTLNLDEDSWIEFRQLNDVAYDRVFFDIWFQIDFENSEEFPYSDPDDPEESDNEFIIPLASYYSNDGKDLKLSTYTKLSVCKVGVAKEVEKSTECKDKVPKSQGIFTYHLKEHDGETEHLIKPSEDGAMKSHEDGYWQLASFYIDLDPDHDPADGDKAAANFLATPHLKFDKAVDAGEAFSTEFTQFEKDGVWKIGHHDALDSSSPITIGAVRFWRQPSITAASAAAITKTLADTDRNKPGTFHDIASLGEPDGVLLADGDWSTQRKLPKEDSNYIREMRGSWWGAALGKPTLVTQKQGSANNEIFEKTRQIFAHTRAANARSGPPAPTQLYRLFTCDENGGASIVETHRNLRRDDDEWNVSWEPQL